MEKLVIALNVSFQMPPDSLWAICSFKSRMLPIVHNDIIDNCDDLEICENYKLSPKYQQMLSELLMKIMGITSVFLREKMCSLGSLYV